MLTTPKYDELGAPLRIATHVGNRALAGVRRIDCIPRIKMDGLTDPAFVSDSFSVILEVMNRFRIRRMLPARESAVFSDLQNNACLGLEFLLFLTQEAAEPLVADKF